MEKPPFQFGLMAAFAVTTGAAALLATWVAFPLFLKLLALLAVQTLVGLVIAVGLIWFAELLRGTPPDA